MTPEAAQPKATEEAAREVRVRLLGSFEVIVGENRARVADWPSRRASELVQLLALADGRRLPRERVIETLWPHLEPEAGGANLRKAAHHARRTLGVTESVVLRSGQVHLFPEATVRCDAAEFEAAAAAALANGAPDACRAAASAYTGELLPDSPYEPWVQEPRERLHGLLVELLRQGGELERLVEVEPTDEDACLELMRRDLAAGRRAAVIRWYGRLRTALRGLGLSPGPATRAVYEECVADLGVDEPQLSGRDQELARISALLGNRPAAGYGALAVRGPAGIGKSALCRELVRLAREAGWAAAACSAVGVGTPYAPLADAIHELTASTPASPELVGAEASRVLGRLAHGPDGSPSDVALTRHKVVGALRRLLVAAAREREGAVLVVDDAHLADEATIDALQQLASDGRSPILVALAYRGEPAPESLRRGVARLARAGRAVEIELEPLGREAVAALVAAVGSGPADERAVDRIFALGEGNPFLTLELARSEPAGSSLHPTVRDALVLRFLDLDERILAGLRALALVGGELEPAAAIAVAGGTETESFAVLDAGLGTGALITGEGRYRFRHELLRTALTEQLAPHRRLALHREAARRLEATDAAPELVARQWLLGDCPAKASPWQLAAARRAAELGAYADALAHLDPLLEHNPRHGEAQALRAQALDVLGEQEAPQAYRRAAALIGGSRAHDLRAMAAVAQIKLGDPPGGLESLRGVSPASLEGRVAEALAYAGAASLGFGDPALGGEKAEEARRLALEAGDADAVAVASWAQASAAHARGELPDSYRIDVRDTRALPELATSVFDGQLCTTQRLLYGARPYAEVVAFADSLAEEAERLGAIRGEAFALTIGGEAKLLCGRLGAAEDDLRRGIELHRRLGAPTGESFALQRRAEIALHRGRREEAMGILDEALSIARESDCGFHLFDRIYGSRIAAGADPEEAFAALEEAEGAVRGPAESCPTCRITLAVPAAIAAARAGDTERADRWIEVATYLTEVVMRLPAWDAALLEVRGHRAGCEGDTATARERFELAARGFEAAGHPLDSARCAELARSVG